MPRRKYKELNYSNFTKVKCPYVAYLLGLFYADGTLCTNSYTIKINMVEDDMNTLLPIFKKTGEWSVRFSDKGSNRQKQIILSSFSKKLYLFLKKKYYKNSTKNLLNNIHHTVKRYWYRGVIDGDGSFFIRHDKKKQCGFNISGPDEQDWQYITKLLDQLDIKYTVNSGKTHSKKKNKRYSRFSRIDIYNQEGIVKLGRYIYAGDSFGLKRKYQKFRQINKRYNARTSK